MREDTRQWLKAAEHRAKELDGAGHTTFQERYRTVAKMVQERISAADLELVREDLQQFLRSEEYPLVLLMLEFSAETSAGSIYLGDWRGPDSVDAFYLKAAGITKISNDTYRRTPTAVSVVTEEDLWEVARAFRNENSRGLPSERIANQIDMLARTFAPVQAVTA